MTCRPHVKKSILMVTKVKLLLPYAGYPSSRTLVSHVVTLSSENF